MFYPAFINIEGRRCVVIGGGAVAARKAETLLRAGAEVVVIAPELSSRMGELAMHSISSPSAGNAESATPVKPVKPIARRYRKGDLRSAFIAVAATDDAEVNLKVCRDALELGILVNCITPPDAGNFIVPSASSRGGLTIAVSTAGKCPAAAKLIRRELDDYTAGYPALLSFLEEARAMLREVLPCERDRAAALDKLAAVLMETFRTEPGARALRLAEKEFRKLIG